MEQSTVVYHKLWTKNSLVNMRCESNELSSLSQGINELKSGLDVNYGKAVMKIVDEVDALNRELRHTYICMEQYMYDMERGIAKVAELIEEAEQFSVKQFE